jgi:gamma-glutamylcyclotransferase (GGCT)/AIG2-like uncharacterized protein YtfP
MGTSQPAGGNSPPQHVFAYGSLVDPGCLDEVLGHPHAGERLPARLEGYERITTAAYPFPYIVAARGKWVDGVLVMDLDRDDLLALDEYEEVDKGIYARERVQVEAWGRGPRSLRLQALTYVAGPGLLASTADG